MSLRRLRPGSWLGLGCVAVALASLPSVGLPAAAQAKWGRPFQFAPPAALDVLAPQLAFSPSGASAAGFGLQDVDTPGSSVGYLTTRSPGGAVGRPQAIPSARQILALAYDRGSLELLTGAGSADQTCCSSAQAIPIGAGGRPGRARTLVGGLAGAAQGQLLTLGDGQMLAAVATARGVWVVQAARGNRFGGQHLLTRAGELPQSLAATALSGSHSIVAWTAASGTAGATDPRAISIAAGSRSAAPGHPRTVVTVPAGHRVDELAVAPGAGGATLAWIESWYDGRGGYHSQVMATDVGAGAAIRTLSPGNRQAAGLQFAGDAGGDQALAWESCTTQPACATVVATRRAGGRFGAPSTLGAIDPSQAPAVSVGPQGQVVVGWVRGGRPMAALQAGPGRGFSSPVPLSSTTYAADITVAAGPRGRTLAAWSQGTLNASVVGAAG